MLGCILLFALFYGLFFANGYVGSDGARYFDAAHKIADGDWEELAELKNDPATYRLGLIIPAALALSLSGFDPVAASLYLLLFHIGTVFLIYAIGALLHNRGAGLVAAALVAAWPSAVLYAAAPLPDPACFFFLCVSLYALIMGQKKISRIPAPAWFTMCGLLMGLAVTAKQTALFAFPVFLLAAFFSQKDLPFRQRLLNCASLLLGLAVILGIYTVMLEGFLGRGLGWLISVNDGKTSSIPVARNPANPLERIQYLMMILRQEHGAWRFFLLATFAYPLFFRSRSQLTLAATSSWMLLYHLFGTISLSSYSTPSIQTRYFLFFTLFSAIAAGAIIERLGHYIALKRPSRTVVIAVVFLFMAGGLFLLKDSSRILNQRSGTRYYTAAQRGLAAALQHAFYFAPGDNNRVFVLTMGRTDIRPFNSELDPRVIWNRRNLDIDEYNEILREGFFVVIPAYDYERHFPSLVKIDESLVYREGGNCDLFKEIYLAKIGLNNEISVRDFGPVPLAVERTELWIRALGGRALSPESKTSYASGRGAHLFYLEKSPSGNDIVSHTKMIKRHEVFSLQKKNGYPGFLQYLKKDINDENLEIEDSSPGFRVILHSDIDRKYLNFQPGSWKNPPKAHLFPTADLLDPRSITVSIDYSLNMPAASFMVWVLQYDEDSRLAPPREALSLECREPGNQAFSGKLSLEEDTKQIRILLRIAGPKGLILEVNSLEVFQFSAEDESNRNP